MARVSGLSAWEDDPAWASIYDWMVEHPRVGGTLWRIGLGSDLGELHRATAEIGRLPVGASVLDVPCGGGVALRGIQPGQDLHYVAADIAPAMLERTMAAARRRGVDGQVVPTVADVHALQFGDGEFDLVVSFTGLHCFPRPKDAVNELARVTRPGGALTGSTLLSNLTVRGIPLMIAGRIAGLLGPGVSAAELPLWLAEAGFSEVVIRRSGPMAYFHAVRS